MESDGSPPCHCTGGEKPPPSSDQSTITLLYVDGHERRRAEYTDVFETADQSFDVTPAATCEEALGALGTADCVVSWYDLPETNALELATNVRERYCDLPFVLLATDGSERLASEATATGVTDYVPVDKIDTAGDRLLQRVTATVDTNERCVTTSQLNSIGKAIENAADGILITDTDGTIEYVNPAFESVTGFDRNEVLGKNPRILKSGEHDESYYEQLWNAILDGKVWEEEIINETKSGDRYVAHQTIAPVTDGDGSIEKFVGIQRDVTRRQRLEEQVQRSAMALEHLYEVGTEEPMDLQSKLDTVLKIGTEYLEFPVGYVTRITDNSQHVLAAVGDHEMIQEGATDPLERTYCRKTIANDEPVVVSDALAEGWEDDPAFERFGLQCYVGSKVVVDGELYGTLCFGGEEPMEQFVLDIQKSTVKTLANWLSYEIERYEYEHKLKRQNERLEKFASVVSHDLRNPLNVAQARLEIGRESGDEEHFDIVADSHDRMEAIIDDTLTLAREGEFVDETESVSLHEIATDCWQTVETDEATLEMAEETTVEADPDRLRHVFENLFRNAIEHGGRTVTVDIGPMDNGFYIADDGPGIPPAEREKVFDHGYSGGDGTGFGLAIVESVADAHGWSVAVTDSETGGARFEFVTDRAGSGDAGRLDD